MEVKSMYIYISRRIIACLLLAFVTFFGLFSNANADAPNLVFNNEYDDNVEYYDFDPTIYNPYGVYWHNNEIEYKRDYYNDENEYYYGIIISTNVNVRIEPSSKSKSIAQLHNGDIVTIIDNPEYGWYEIELEEFNAKDDYETGFIHSYFVAERPRYVSISYNPATLFYTPWHTVSNYDSSYKDFLIISENKDFICVQATDNKAGSLFLDKSELGRLGYSMDYNEWSRDYLNRKAWIVLTQYTTLYATPWEDYHKNGEKVSDTFMRVISENRDYYCVRLNDGVAFIKKSDVGYYEGGNAYYVRKDATIYDAENGERIGNVEKGDIVFPDKINKNKAFIYFGEDDSKYGYIDFGIIEKILN